MVLVQNWPFFHVLFLRQCRPGKCVLRYSIALKRLFWLKKQDVETVKKLSFC